MDVPLDVAFAGVPIPAVEAHARATQLQKPPPAVFDVMNRLIVKHYKVKKRRAVITLPELRVALTTIVDKQDPVHKYVDRCGVGDAYQKIGWSVVYTPVPKECFCDRGWCNCPSVGFFTFTNNTVRTSS
jgi:hypothetical protein